MSGPLPRRLLVLGGGSEIASAFVESLLAHDLELVVLAGRAGGTVDDAATALLGRAGTTRVEIAGFDGADVHRHRAALESLHRTHGPFDTVLVAFGRLGDPFTLDADPGEAADLVTINHSGAVSACLASIGVLRGIDDARLIVLSSVTALRPRITNIVYGSAKAGLDAFLTEIRDPAAAVGVEVVVVRPGFVHTRMTEGVEPAPMATTADAVAADMIAGLRDRRTVIHSPAALNAVGKVLRLLPGPIWRRISNR